MRRKDRSTDDQQTKVSGFTGMVVTIFFIVFSLAFLFPIFLAFMNVFKSKLYISGASFWFLVAEAYVGLGNYTEGVRKTGFFMALGRSLFITVRSVAVVVLFAPMTVWYTTGVKTKLYSVLYYAFVSTIIVPLRVAMFTVSEMANDLYLDSIYGPILLYPRLGAGQVVFLFCGFVKTTPLETEKAAMTDGYSPVQTYFHVVLLILRPATVTVAILNVMRIWNDYLLPNLILPQEKGAISMVIQNLRGGYGSVDIGATMAMLVPVIVPIIIFYLSCQRHIIKGMVAGAVKG